MPISQQAQETRSEIYEEVVEAFATKYSWLGAQASREMLMSVASWNINKYSDPPFRYRNHLMLSWERGWLKSTMMRKMANILGDEMVSTIGKVTDASMRGSISAGKFMPPKPLKTPIVISTEFGQTDFDEELLNLFLNMLEEGYTNVSLNKIGSLPDSAKQNIEEQYPNEVEFGEENEFDLKCDFVFWGATYDVAYMQDDAMRSRFQLVTPIKPLSSEVTKQLDKAPSVESQLSKDTIKQLRREVKKEEEVKTRFTPPDHLYDDYNVNPRESRDIQAYMACRNWWGLEVNPEVMADYIEHLQESRRVAHMSPKERVFELIFDDPHTYQEIEEETGFNTKHIYKLLQELNAKKVPMADGPDAWAVHSGDDSLSKLGDEDEDDDVLDQFGGGDSGGDGGGFLENV